MRLARHRQLDALIGEYMLGSLRGGARRRFERALREEPAVALRLRTLQQEFTPRYSERIARDAARRRLATARARAQSVAIPSAVVLARFVPARLGARCNGCIGARSVVVHAAYDHRDDADSNRATGDEGCAAQRDCRLVGGSPHARIARCASDRRGAFAKLRAVGDSGRRRADFAGSTWSTRRNTARARRTRRTFAQRCAAGDLGRTSRAVLRPVRPPAR